MHDKIKESLHKLSSKKVMERKKALKQVLRHIHHKDAYLIRLSLHYISLHDPSYTVRNLARQAFYRIGGPPDGEQVWEKTHLF